MQPGFQTFIPVLPVLKKYISYFYTDVQEDPAFHRKYTFFPHVNTTLSFYRNAAFSEGPEHNTVVSNDKFPLLQVLTRQRKATTVVQEGPISKIGIVFHPLGLNHFVNENYDSLARGEVQHFIPGNQLLWAEQITQCFRFADSSNCIAHLEKFLASLYQPRDYHTLYKVLQDLNDAQSDLSIKQVAGKNFINHRKMNRDFIRELAITPELYKMIARFRYAVQQRIQQEGPDRLTSLAYESGYLDQSYMIRSFKKLTGLTPAAFFREGKHIGIADTFWKFHNTKNVV